jgi:hypothetical protein
MANKKQDPPVPDKPRKTEANLTKSNAQTSNKSSK